MSKELNIYLAQLNPTVGAIKENCELIAEAYARACMDCADLVVTPELSVVGYPPEDLVLKPYFQKTVAQAINGLAELTIDVSDPGLLVGAPWLAEDGKLYNALILLDNGSVAAICYKHELPNYGVFDEIRLFQRGSFPSPVLFRGAKLGLMICEDMWFPTVAAHLKDTGADILIVPTCSPYEHDKYQERMKHAHARVKETHLPLVFCNQIGGQDELVFDGASFILDGQSATILQMNAWMADEKSATFCLNTHTFMIDSIKASYNPMGDECLYQAMVLGVRDYVNKNRFPGVLIGLSGGIDSALTAAIAVDALGASKVHCVMMPSRYTGPDSIKDAAECADALGVPYKTIPIKAGVEAYDAMLGQAFKGLPADTTEENIQSRLRGLVLMSLSNKFGYMVLTTGNKSEMSVGYATLYGDMCGGYNPLKDLYKTDAFRISHWRNTQKPAGALGPQCDVIPINIITKPPTAELRADQKDEDSLPPYDVLDDMLRCLVDEEMSVKEIVARGHDATEVARIEHLLYIAEYKRRQASPGVKLTRKNFGRDRRYPITNGFRSARS